MNGSRTNSMESLYFSAPKPFNRYPNGYRPITDNSTRTIRPSISWSSFPQDESRGSQPPMSPVSRWPSEVITNPIRNTSSFSYYPQPSPTFSPNDNFSPFSVTSEQLQSNRFTFSPPVDNSYQSAGTREQGFLANLHSSQSPMPSYHDPSSPPFSTNHYETSRYPTKRLSKTQSDFSNDRHQHHIPNQYNASKQMGGFFNSGHAEPSWMTHPPPPKAFQHDAYLNSSDVLGQSSSSSSFNQPEYVPQQRSAISNSYYPDTNRDHNAFRQPVFGARQTVEPNVTTYQSPRNSNHSEYVDDVKSQNYPDYSQSIPLTQNRVLHIFPNANQTNYDSLNYENRRPSSNVVQQHEVVRSSSAAPVQNRARFTSPYRELHVDVLRPEAMSPPPRTTDPMYQVFSPVESKVYNRTTPTVINGFKTIRNDHLIDRPLTDRRNLPPPVAVIEPNKFGSQAFPYYSSNSFDQQHQLNTPPRRTLTKLNPPALASSWSPSSTYDNDSDFEIDDPLDRRGYSSLPRGGVNIQTRRRVQPKEIQRNTLSRDNLQGILVKRPTNYKSSKKVVFEDQNRGGAEAPPHVRAYDAAVEGGLAKFSQLSDEIGGDVAVVKSKAIGIFDALRHFLWTAAGSVEPSQAGLVELFKPLVDQMEQLTQFKDSKRNTPQFNHLSAVAEGIPAVAWVSIKKTPAPYAKEMVDAAMYYVNRILREFKGTDPKQVDWANSWKELLEDMVKFVRQTHTTGVVWNSAPGNLPSGKPASGGAPSAPKAGGPPPPPPPPPPADIFANIPPPAAPANNDKANRDALFAALNQGEAVTAGLRKVTSDMQTHKNPNLRGTAPIPDKIRSSNTTSVAQAAPVQRPPRLEIEDGKRWAVEYFKNDKNIVINVTDKKQAIYVYKCENSVIRVNGKANSVTLDSCKKTSIVFDALVAQCETINCQSIQIQTLGEMPTISIQKTDGCQVYLSLAAHNAEIVSSKSSEMNVLVQTTEDGDYVEYPIPEQFKSTYVGGKVVTTVSEIV